MSMAAPPRAGQSTYDVSRPLGKCCVCGNVIEPDQKLMTMLRETPTGFERVDCEPGCWEKADRANLIAHWQTVMPRAEQKKKLFVDDTVLCEIFERLSDAAEDAKLSFRFVLGLILMRKRLVVYEDTRQDSGREIWKVRMKGKEQRLDLVNPRLDEEQIRQVSAQLGEILQQEL